MTHDERLHQDLGEIMKLLKATQEKLVVSQTQVNDFQKSMRDRVEQLSVRLTDMTGMMHDGFERLEGVIKDISAERMENGERDGKGKKFDFGKEEEEHDDSENCYQSIDDLLKEHILKVSKYIHM
ncbi:unnamed protein product [Linum trigynum]|uniref:Uncharacterized protein n=1 Tax=Linum trigynum TaxID=586398 RepID=A0AAV2FY59_9ROSI